MYSGERDISPYIEKKKHGNMLFPFAVYGTWMPYLYASYPLHCHEEIEVVYADCGTCRYTVSGKELDLHLGDILVMMPWTLHSFRLMEEGQYFLGSSYLISLNFISSGAVDICSKRYFTPLLTGRCNDYCLITAETPGYDEFRCTVEAMFNAYMDHPPFFELRLKSLTGSLLYQLLDGGHIKILEKSSDGSDVIAARQVVDYISEHFSENITVAKLAQTVSMSETGLSRLFRNVTGMSCIDYVIEFRMSKAMSLVRFTDKPIIEIAYETGFNNISYFNRTFKRHFHQTPSQCRKENLSGENTSNDS